MTTSLQIAAKLIRGQAVLGRPVTNFELQKLIYFCHGWSLGLLAQPLVREPFEAWKHGPVLPSLFHTFKVFSVNPIPVDHPFVAQISDIDDLALNSLIDRVIEVYGPCNSVRLMDMSQLQDSPWRFVWDSRVKDGEISDSSIMAYFKRMANQN